MTKPRKRSAPANRKAPPAPFHYTASGLDDVWLLNGFTIEETPYGPGVSIQDAEGLHNALAQAIATAPAPMRAAEWRFLRKHLNLSQEAMARLLGCSAQSVARWEKGQASIDPAAERLLRFVMLQALGQEVVMREALDELAEWDGAQHRERRLRHRAGAWKQAA